MAISQKTFFADELVTKFHVFPEQNVLFQVNVKLEKKYNGEETENCPFHELLIVCSFIWLPTSTRPDISNAVRAVAGCRCQPNAVHWKAALGILGYIKGTSDRA